MITRKRKRKALFELAIDYHILNFTRLEGKIRVRRMFYTLSRIFPDNAVKLKMWQSIL